jgi:hypothetical protein
MIGFINAVTAGLLFGGRNVFATSMFLSPEKYSQKKGGLCGQNKNPDKI